MIAKFDDVIGKIKRVGNGKRHSISFMKENHVLGVAA